MLFDWRSLPSLTALRAFEATARVGSFAGAARALNVTHAAVAQQVRALEQELGVSLARRQGRQVVLTGAGQRLARTLTAAFTAISDEIIQTRADASSRGLRVTCSPFMAHRTHHLPSRLRGMRQRKPCPDIRPNVSSADPGPSLRALRSSGVREADTEESPELTG
jgi:DNA-binding transcriptional LysR family regulator